MGPRQIIIINMLMPALMPKLSVDGCIGGRTQYMAGVAMRSLSPKLLQLVRAWPVSCAVTQASLHNEGPSSRAGGVAHPIA
jgi:hypothetical protein